MAKRKTAQSPREKLFKTAFAAAERNGWKGLRIADVAKSAGLTVAEAYRIAPDRAGLLDAYAEEIDARALEKLEPAAGDSLWSDIAFDALMLRFDAMLKNRDALRVIYFDDRRDPIALAHAARRTARSLERMLEASGFSDDSLALKLGAAALVPLYAGVLKIWLNDEPDQARTMAALDKALKRLDRWSRRAARSRADSTSQEDAPDDADDRPATNGSLH